MKNTASAGQPAAFSFANQADIVLTPAVGFYDKATFADVDNDGKNDLLLAKINGQLHYYRNTGTAANPVFSSISDKYGNIENINFFSDLLHITIADMNADGKPDIIAGNGNGQLLFYDDLRSGASGAALTSNENLIYNPVWTLTTTHYLGDYINPAAGDLNGDNKPDLIVGVRGGGLLYFENGIVTTSLAKKIIPEPDFDLLPNPAEHFVYIKSPEKAEWQLINTSGQIIETWQTLKPQEATTYNVSKLKAGLYIVQFRTQNGAWSRKMIIK